MKWSSATLPTQLWDLVTPLKANLFGHKLHSNQIIFTIAISIRGDIKNVIFQSNFTLTLSDLVRHFNHLKII